METLKCWLQRTGLLATVPLLIALASCGGAAGGAALPEPADPPDSQLIALNATGNAPLNVNFAFAFTGPALSDVTYQWEWDTDGDGDMDMLVNPGGPNIALGFPDPGSFKVKLTVTGKDGDGNVVVIHKEVTVEAH
jgi:PKD repeat protein